MPTPLATCVPSAIVRVDFRSESEEAPLQYGEWSEASEVGRMCDHEPDDNGLGKSALESRSGAAGDADSIRDRLLRMLIGEGERHRRSGLDSVIGQCTNRFIVTVRRVVTDVWKARETDIRRSCGPHLPTGLIDEMDVLAYVLADASGDLSYIPMIRTSLARRWRCRRRVWRHDWLKQSARLTALCGRRLQLLQPIRPSCRACRPPATQEMRLQQRKVLDTPYDPKPPGRTVGAKRKIDESVLLRRAEAALRTAKQEVRRTEHELDKLGALPEPDLPEDINDEAGEAAAWRRWEREREMRERAHQAVTAATMEQCQKEREFAVAWNRYLDQEDRRRHAKEMEASRQQEQREQHHRNQLKREQVRCPLPTLSCATPTVADCTVRPGAQDSIADRHRSWMDERDRERRQECGCVCASHC